MTVEILPIERRHIGGFRNLLDEVARERRWLALLEAPPLDRVRRVVLARLRDGGMQFVAVDADRVVGWCDVTPKTHETVRHSGSLGMGLAHSHRGRGLGSALLATTLDAAFSRGLTRIDLTVREDNTAAIALYTRHAFEHEGRLRRYMIVDGQAYDALQMARLA